MKKPNYGIDAPGVIRNFYLLGAVMVGVGIYLLRLGLGWTDWVAQPLIWWGASWLASSTFMILYSRVGKFKHRDRILRQITWKGDENVLDIGTGRGLLMIGAAKKLTTGRSFGIDIWNQEDLSDNSAKNALQNAEAEGVSAKIEIKNEDVRKMTFPNGFFDVVVSNLCLHNIYDEDGRRAACAEIARVLKPGGQLIISDFRHTKEYTSEFQKEGIEATLGKPLLFNTFPPLRIITGVKPSTL